VEDGKKSRINCKLQTNGKQLEFDFFNGTAKMDGWIDG
jgi:hypothetical protein